MNDPIFLEQRPKPHSPKWEYVDEEDPNKGIFRVPRDEYFRRVREALGTILSMDPTDEVVRPFAELLESVYDETRLELLEDLRWQREHWPKEALDTFMVKGQ